MFFTKRIRPSPALWPGGVEREFVDASTDQGRGTCDTDRWSRSGRIKPCSAGERDEPKRMVLVELYTSQGCDMCPTAEKMLGALAERESRIVPIAFHVDYFNEPWQDVFSDPLYSQRQMAYNQLYTKPKNQEYGLYYTPMLMIDGRQSVNGRDPASAEAAIRQALARKPAVGLDVALDVGSDGRSGKATIKVTSRSAGAEKSPLLVCAVLREDGVVTDVKSGENARQIAGRAVPGPADEIRVHRARRQVAHDKGVHVRDPAELEPSKPSARRVRSGQAHRRHPPGDRSPLAFDPTRRDIDDQRGQSRRPRHVERSFDVIPDPIDGARGGGRAARRADRLLPGQGEARVRTRTLA